ncbi:hypothetical protein DFH06DRAFT_1298545 [Mycena polygramma]|nr:hypothetical protein DFH06DRAFT_1298545 [Mycena polygramma]
MYLLGEDRTVSEETVSFFPIDLRTPDSPGILVLLAHRKNLIPLSELPLLAQPEFAATLVQQSAPILDSQRRSLPRGLARISRSEFAPLWLSLLGSIEVCRHNLPQVTTSIGLEPLSFDESAAHPMFTIGYMDRRYAATVPNNSSSYSLVLLWVKCFNLVELNDVFQALNHPPGKEQYINLAAESSDKNALYYPYLAFPLTARYSILSWFRCFPRTALQFCIPSLRFSQG